MNSEKVKEIKKALECCSKGECGVWCPRFDKKNINHTCQDDMNADALNLINEVESENKSLQDLCNKTYENLTKEIDRLEKENTEQLKQFAERLKAKMPCKEVFKGIWDKIDETLKEFTNE